MLNNKLSNNNSKQRDENLIFLLQQETFDKKHCSYSIFSDIIKIQ